MRKFTQENMTQFLLMVWYDSKYQIQDRSYKEIL